MLNPKAESQCTVKLLSIAAQAIYRVKKDNIIDPTYSEDYSRTITDIAQHGYAIAKAIVPVGSKGTGKTSLGALCLEPQDSTGPIIISFRGTKTGSDVFSDLRLGVTGTVDKKFRDSAFEFYQKVQKENPGREIILTGHSLGGHIAQYVATKAYNTNPELIKNPLIQVRTFNTAPLDTTHSSVFQKAPHVLSQFVNYRLSSDVVSNLPLQRYQGNTFVFPSDKGFLGAHPMGAINTLIPAEIMQQRVGNNSLGNKQHHQLIELTNGILSSYQCMIEGQYFSRFRAGAKNLEAMQKILPEVIKSIKEGNYDDAILKINDLKGKLNGKTSDSMIEVIRKSIMSLKEKPKVSVEVEPFKVQKSMKSELQLQRAEIQRTDTTLSEESSSTNRLG